MAEIIDGKAIAREMQEELKAQVAALKDKGVKKPVNVLEFIPR